MKYVVFPDLHSRAYAYKAVPTTDGLGTTSQPDGEDIILSEVSLDITTLHVMAKRAARSKGQKCTAGPLTVRVTSRTKVAKPEVK